MTTKAPASASHYAFTRPTVPYVPNRPLFGYRQTPTPAEEFEQEILRFTFEVRARLLDALRLSAVPLSAAELTARVSAPADLVISLLAGLLDTGEAVELDDGYAIAAPPREAA